MKFYFTQELKNEILKICDSLEKSLSLDENTYVIVNNKPRLHHPNFEICRKTGYKFNGIEFYNRTFTFELDPTTINKQVYDNYMNLLINENGPFENWSNKTVAKNCFSSNNLTNIFAQMLIYWTLRFNLVSDIEDRTYYENHETTREKDLTVKFNSQKYFSELDQIIEKDRVKNIELIKPAIKILMNHNEENPIKIGWLDLCSIIKSMPVDEEFTEEKTSNTLNILYSLHNWTQAMDEVFA